MPENSPAALDAAVDACIEMAEIDLRLSADGVPVPIHDWNLERVTNGTGVIYSTTSAQWSQLYLKDRTGAVTTTPTPSLIDILDTLAKQPTLSLVLDCKDSSSVSSGLPSSYDCVKATWPLILKYEHDNTVSLKPRIVFKVLFRELPPDPTTLSSDLDKSAYLNLVPIWYSEDEKKYPTFANQILPNYRDIYLQGNSFLWWPEVVVKYPGLPPDGTPTLEGQISSDSQNTTAFNTAPDWPEGTSMGSGLCCRARNTAISVTYSGPNISDFTGDMEYLYYMAFNLFSSDKVLDLVNYLTARGLRDTGKLTQQHTKKAAR